MMHYSRLLRAMVLIASMLGCRTITMGRELPDTVWVPVIFCDYRADPSTEDFEQPFSGDCYFGLLENMVKEKISDDRKPVPNPPRNLFGCASHLDEWYRPSGNDGPAANSQFAFNTDNSRWEWSNLVPRQGGTPGEYVATDYNPDYERATIVIYDSLPFVHVPSEGEGTYRFSRTGKDEPSFFWINDRGFGNEGKGSNYAFTMEMHHDFTCCEGLKFDFNGDDDVWVFINDSLVLDLGGSSGPMDGSFDVDDIPGLELGKNYHFDFFYAERHTFASTIRITTNLLDGDTYPVAIESRKNGQVRAERVPRGLQLVDLKGRPVKGLSASPHNAHGGGYHAVSEGVPAGVYFLKGLADGVAHESRIVAGD